MLCGDHAMRSHDGWTKGHTRTPLRRELEAIRHIVLAAVRDARGNCCYGLAEGDEVIEVGEFGGEILGVLLDLS
jgi:hypothetical protein